MRPRIIIGRFLQRLGRFIHSLAIMVMRPDDLVVFNRQIYATPGQLTYFGGSERVAQGLNPLEKSLLDKIPLRQGCLLLLGVGGGREAIPLARLGFEVTGVDFIPDMVQKAQENASNQGVKIAGLVQEISAVNVPPGFYDLVWLSQSMYSCVPTRKRRVEMLRRILKALRPGGYCVCMFHWEPRDDFSPKVEFARKVFAFLTRGNLEYEPGDILWLNSEFIHAFSSEAGLKSEFGEGGFVLSYLHLPKSGVEGGAVLVAR